MKYLVDDPDDIFGPVVLSAEPLTMHPHDDPARIQEIQRRLQGETKDYRKGVAKRQMVGGRR